MFVLGNAAIGSKGGCWLIYKTLKSHINLDLI